MHDTSLLRVKVKPFVTIQEGIKSGDTYLVDLHIDHQVCYPSREVCASRVRRHDVLLEDIDMNQ
jgi:hypothetical protein